MLLKRFYTIVSLFVCLLQTSMVKAQMPAFQHLTVENGLSQNAILSITQDSRDFIWMGSSNGLNRYDGFRFKVYQSNANDSTSLDNNNVLSLLSDSKKNLWVGTAAGLNKYLPETDKFKRIQAPARNPLTFQCFYEDRRGRIWVGTDGGLFVITPGDDKLHLVMLPGINDSAMTIRAILEDHNGYLWIGTSRGLFVFTKAETTAPCTVFRNDPGNSNSISGDIITSLIEDHKGAIWIGTQTTGVNRYESGPGIFTRFFHQPSEHTIINNNIRRMLVDRLGRIWVGTQDGITVLDEQGKSLYILQQDDANPGSLSQNSIYALFQDQTGNVWVGTYFGGANYSYAINTQFFVLRKKDQPGYLNNNVISSIVEDERKNLWIGTEGGGLNYFDRSSGKIENYKYSSSSPGSVGSNLIKFVYRDRQGQIWAGTHGGGLNLFDPARKEFRKFMFRENDPASLSEEFSSIYQDSKARLWVGAKIGTKIFTKVPGGLEPVNATFAGKMPLSLMAIYFLEDDKGRFWLSTADGIYVMQSEQFRKVSGDVANCIVQNRNGEIWLGLHEGGLGKFNEKTGRIEYYNQPDKIANRSIFGILEDDLQNLWLSSDRGLLKFNPRQDQLQIFAASDGLAGNAFNNNSFFKDSRGEFFFGGLNGITHFFPEKIQSNQRVANLVITGLRLFNGHVEPGDSTGILRQTMTTTSELQLKHDQDVFTVEFALLNYIKSNKNSYAYKLDGFDKDWIYTNTPQASYTNLPAGSFTLYIKGVNNDGVWSKPVSLKIHLLPPFWRTWWAYCLYVLASLGIVFLVLRYFFIGALLKKEEEMHQVKLNFFTNISHEIRTHLTLIMAPVEKMMDSQELNSFTQQQLGAVKQNANRLLRLVSELMDFRKAETGYLKLSVKEQNLFPFLEDVFRSFRDISEQKGIATSIVYNGEYLPLYFDNEQLEKVFFNLIANAIKFTPTRGRIWVEVIEREKEVIVKVADNGRGIAPEYNDKVFTNFFQVNDHGVQNTGYGIGLALAKNIVMLHQGTIAVESRPSTETEEGATVFIVTLLKGSDHFTSDQLKDPREEHAEEKYRKEATQPPALGNQVEENIALQLPSLLVVEDNEELRALIRDHFIDKYTIYEATNGAEGMAVATHQIPDIIISDVMMPVTDGLDFCKMLKTDERTSHIPVVLLTAKSTQSDLVSGLETGADIYLTKPFSTKILELNLRNLLAARERLKLIFLRQVSTYTARGPAESPGIISGLNSIEQEFLQRVIAIVEENLDNPDFGVEMLSRKVTMSAPVLYKKIKAVSRMSVNDFIKSIRLKKATQMLSERQMTVYEVAYAVGYNDLKHFRQEFKKQFGKTPSEYAKDGADA